jgi:CubicO group peptidase (beta-lactamase class C family)
MHRRLLYIILFVFAVYFTFFSGKKKEENIPVYIPDIETDSIFININKIYNEQKAAELNRRFGRLNKKGVFNGTVLYAENGEIVYKGAFGYADFRKKEKLTTQSAFQLASVSKMFTAMAIMILQEEGELEYDDTVTKFIPELPYHGVTIRNLLNHRSGLSRYMSLTDKYWEIDKPVNNEDVIKLFVKYKPAPYFKPDNGFHYCNTNYALLASVVERITGESFDVFVKERIFEPAGMSRSFVYSNKNDSVIRSAVPVGVQGYRNGRRRLVKVGDYYLNGVMGDKGVYSTVEDLYKFSKALDNETLVSSATLRQAFTPGSPKSWRRKDNYGFGWRIKTKADSTVYHFGWWKGFRTFFIRDMANDRVIISLTNTHHGVSSQVFWSIIEDKNRPEEIENIYAGLINSIEPALSTESFTN